MVLHCIYISSVISGASQCDILNLYNPLGHAPPVQNCHSDLSARVKLNTFGTGQTPIRPTYVMIDIRIH